MCPTGWFIETQEAPGYLDDNLAAVHEPGVLKDVLARVTSTEAAGGDTGTGSLLLCSGTLPRGIPLRRTAGGGGRGRRYDAISMWGRDHAAARAEGLSDADMRTMLDDHGLVVAELDPAWWWITGSGRARCQPPSSWTPTTSSASGRTTSSPWPMRSVPARSTRWTSWAAPGTSTTRPRPSPALCHRAAEHGLLVHMEWLPWSKIPDLATARGDRAAGRPSQRWAQRRRLALARAGITVDELRAAAPGRGSSASSSTTGPSKPEDNLIDATLHAGASSPARASSTSPASRALRATGRPRRSGSRCSPTLSTRCRPTRRPASRRRGHPGRTRGSAR